MIKIKKELDKLIIYKKDKCIICTEECNKFIKSPCCNNSYGCYDCMLKYKKCLICHKKIDILYYIDNMNYNKALQIANEIKKKVRGLIITGSLTRGHDIINDIDFLTFRDLDDVVNDFKKKIACVNINKKELKELF